MFRKIFELFLLNQEKRGKISDYYTKIRKAIRTEKVLNGPRHAIISVKMMNLQLNSEDGMEK